jgi:hypothetical protein
VSSAHSALAWFASACWCLHVAGALKHHFLEKDTVLWRHAAAGGTSRPSELTMRALVLGVAAALLIAPVAEARPYAVNKAASKLGFTGSMNGAAFNGTFSRWDATIDFDRRTCRSPRPSVTVDMSSATTGDGARDEALPSSDWFATSRHPRATFVTRSITRTGPNRYAAAGTLTIRACRGRWCCPSPLRSPETPRR